MGNQTLQSGRLGRWDEKLTSQGSSIEFSLISARPANTLVSRGASPSTVMFVSG